MQGPRYEMRKKQRVNRMLNIAIGVVVILIIFFGAQLIFSNSSEQATSEEETSDMTPQHTVPDPIENESETVDRQDSREEEQYEENDEIVDVPLDEEDEELVDIESLEDDLEPVPDGEWEPIGTNQTGEFVHNFDRESQNWAEMTLALRYATGLGDDMFIWRLENGGSPTRARGVVSAPNEQDEPYEVFMEWIDGKGWKPVEKNKLPENPYKSS